LAHDLALVTLLYHTVASIFGTWRGTESAQSSSIVWSLARKLLSHDRIRFAVAIAGVSVSVMLVLVQVGLYFGFMETASSIVDASTADLWVAKAQNESFEFALPYDERTLYKVESLPGVERAERVIINLFAEIKLLDGGDLGLEMVGYEAASGRTPLLGPWHVIAGDARRIAEPGAITIDETEYKKLKMRSVGVVTEIGGVRAEVVAVTSGVRSFTTAPIVFTDIKSARAFQPEMGTQAVTYVLVKVAPGVSRDVVQAEIDALPHLKAYTTAEMSARTRSYWSERTGFGAGIITSAVLSIFVGFVVVGQILYSGTLQYLREYGTLKAIGARNSAVVRLILAQAMISAALGFVIGGVLAVGLRALLLKANLVVSLFPGLYAGIAVGTAVMCSLAAMLSIVKVLRLDPASVFKG
jgi:putative ABC transport system permease protein